MKVVLILLACQSDEAADAVKAFQKAYLAAKDEAGKRAAVEALAKTPHAKTLAALAPLLSSEPETVRIAAAKVLSKFAKIEGAREALEAALSAQDNKKRSSVRISLVRALGDLGDPKALPSVHDRLSDPHVEVAREAVSSCGKLGRLESVPFLIKVLRDFEGDLPGTNPSQMEGLPRPPEDEERRKRAEVLRPPVQQTLRKLTGASCSTVKDWEAWWKKKSGK